QKSVGGVRFDALGLLAGSLQAGQLLRDLPLRPVQPPPRDRTLELESAKLIERGQALLGQLAGGTSWVFPWMSVDECVRLPDSG
ncbi:hypothetical protein ACQX49_12135, partial [Corynebacterium diphtheriae]